MPDSGSSTISARLAKILRVGRSDDPVSSLKAATRWADSLALGDPIKAQAAILAEIKRFNDGEDAPSKERLLILMTLDEKAQDLQAALSRQYLRNARMSRLAESELWHALYQLNWEVLRGYHAHIFSYFRNQGSGNYAAMIPVITLRALRGFRNVIKWRSLRYMHPGEKTWLRLHQLYQIAENQKFHQTRLLVYPDDSQESSCEGEYIHILMLNQADSGSLYPRQIGLIDQWLDTWSEQMTLDSVLDMERHVLAVDMTRDRGARRVRNTGPELSTRYWSTHELLARLKAIQNEIHAGAAPARLGLSENVRASESLELLALLVRQWGVLSAREQRRKPRVTVKKIMEVVHGFDTVFKHMVDSEFDMLRSLPDDSLIRDEAVDVHVYGFVTERTRERLAASLAKPVQKNMADIERWVMEDESECGYGASTQTRDKDWLRVGALVGLRAVNSEEWALGVVRRLSRQSETESSVGFETLPDKPLCVVLHSGKSGAGYMVNGVGIDKHVSVIRGMILNEGSRPVMVMDPMHYQRKAVFEYTHHRACKTLCLGDLVEQGEGWVMCQIVWLDQ